MSYKNVEGGHVFVTTQLALTQPEVFMIAGYRKTNKSFAYRYSTYEDIDSKWIDDSSSYLSFRVFAKDSITGFGKVFSKEYRSKSKSIVSGKFASGTSVEIC